MKKMSLKPVLERSNRQETAYGGPESCLPIDYLGKLKPYVEKWRNSNYIGMKFFC